MEARELLEHAEWLLRNSEPPIADLRSAVSRGYYAIYHFLSEKYPVHKPAKGATHSGFIHNLKTAANNRNLNGVNYRDKHDFVSNLESFYDYRVKADYDISDSDDDEIV